MRLKLAFILSVISLSLFAQPANDDCSSPTIITNLNGGCATFNNTDATPDGTICQDIEGDNTVWFSFTAQGPNLTVEVTGPSNFRPEISVLENACNQATASCVAFEDQVGIYDNITLSQSNILTVGNTYFVAVTTENGAAGDFDLCITNLLPTSCSGDDCNAPSPITINSLANQVCIAGCNSGATAGPIFNQTNPQCEDMPNATVWYEFTTTSATATADISLTSADLNNPEFVIFTTTDCQNFNIINCTEGASGLAEQTNLSLTVSTTYLIAISDVNGDEGNFDLCITYNADQSACNLDNSLEVTATSLGSPLSGPFRPGEVVTFCYEINDWALFDCNYIQGIVPTFGDCWNPISFNPQGQPASITQPLQTIADIAPIPDPIFPIFNVNDACVGDPSGTWDWYTAGSVQYNNINNPNIPNGSNLAAGWFFTTDYDPGSGNCTPTPTDPDNSFGDGDGTCGATNMSGWRVCFELEARPVSACQLGLTDCSVSIKTYADGEIGIFGNVGCTNDLPTVFAASLFCCTADTIQLDTVSACNSTSVFGETFTSSGLAIDSQINVIGCDSFTFQYVVIRNNATSTDSRTECAPYTWIDGNSYNLSTNTPTFTIPGGAANGCDSIVTLDLTISTSVSGTDIQSSCVPFTWIDGNTYTVSNNSATFTIPGGAASGCDSIVTLDLTINSAQTATDTQTACDSFTWIDGNTYTSSNNTATFTIPGGAVGGCDSIVTLDLTINSTQNGTDTQSACNSFTWIDGNTYTSSNNTATFTIPNGATNGCDSIVTLDLIINSTQTGTDTQSACGSFTWIDGNTYTNSNNTATFTIPGGAVGGCDSIVTLDLTINPTQTGTDTQSACDSFTWIDGNTYTNSNNTATFTIPNGATNGCDSIVTLDLIINSTQTGTDTQSACGSFTWIDGNTYTNSNNTATFTIPNGATNGCDSIVSLDLTINSTVSETDIQSACGSFTWIDGNTYTSSNNSATFTIPSSLPGGCDTIITLDLTINTTQTGTDTQSACDSFTWIDGNTYTSSNNTATFTIPNGTVGGCDSIVTLDLTINSTQTGTDTQTACDSFTWIDGNTYTNSNNTATFTIPNGATNGCDSIVSLDLTVNLSDSTFEIQSSCFANDTGSVSQTTSNQFGCDSVHTVTTNLIEVLYTVSPDFATINSKDSLSFFIDNQDSNLRFEWQASDNESCGPLCANFVVNPTENTTFYYFTLVDTSSNCSVTDTLRVDLEYFSQLNVPNIFTPNGDGENDIFRSYGEDIVEYKLEIFDRWGGKMFESNELPSGWNGLFKGSPVESGVYIAVITAAGADGQRYEIVQNIKLVR